MRKVQGQVVGVEDTRDMGFGKPSGKSAKIEIDDSWNIWIKDVDFKLGDKVTVTIELSHEENNHDPGNP